MDRDQHEPESSGGGAGGLHRPSILHGMAYGVFLSGGAGILQALTDSASWRGLLLVVIVFGYLFGGFVAGRGRFGTAARHGAVAAGLSFLVVQGIAALRRLAIGEDVSVTGIIFFGLTAAACGALGGLLATRSPGPQAVRRSR